MHFCRARELAAAPDFNHYGLRICWPAQLVRAPLFSDALASEVRPLAQLLHRRFRRHWPTHGRLRFTAGAVLHERLVRSELAERHRNVEHADAFVDWRAGADEGKTKIASRLVLGCADHIHTQCPQLAVARVIQFGNCVRASAGRSLVFGSTLATHKTRVAADISALSHAAAFADWWNALAAFAHDVASG